jgi:hypothetical protein
LKGLTFLLSSFHQREEKKFLAKKKENTKNLQFFFLSFESYLSDRQLQKPWSVI